MKKKTIIIIAVIAILLIAALALGINIYNNIQNNAEISKDKAIEIALTDANIEGSNASKLRAYLSVDDFNKEYEIEFISSGFEYEYSINAQTGEILDYSKEKADMF